MATTVRGVLYLERDRFQLSLDTRVDIIVYQFPPTMISNLDILDEEGLKQNLTEFLKKNAIVFTNLIILLSSAAVFEKDFKTEEEALIQDYLDNVPYDTISIKKIPIQGGIKVLVGNATLYTLLAETFAQNGVKLNFVIPEIALGGPIGSFNASTARLILTRLEALAQFQFVIDSTTQNTSVIKPPERKEIKKKGILLILIPVFGVLLLVLFFMILQPIIFKPKTTTVIPTLAPARRISPRAKPTTLPIATQSATTQTRKPTSAQISYDQTNAAAVTQLTSSLNTLGVNNVQALVASSNVSAPLVIMAKDIDPIEKQKIIDEIKRILPSATFQDAENISVDVSITIGKSV